MAGTVLAASPSPPNGLPRTGPSQPASGGVEIDLGRTRRGGQRSPCPSNAPQALLTGGPVQPVGHPAGGHQPELRCEIKLFCHVHSVMRGCDTKDGKAAVAAPKPGCAASLACAP